MTGQQRRAPGRQPTGDAPAAPDSQLPPNLPAVRNALDDLVERYADSLTAVMPKHTSPDAFVGLALAYIRRDKALRTAAYANPNSLILALREIAALGHMPMKGAAALVAYRSDIKKHPENNGWQITAIEEVGGVKQRITRAGGVNALVVDVVREKDRARYQRTSMLVPFHEYDEFADPASRGHLRAVYAYAILLNGQPSSVVWMPKDVVMKHRRQSKAGDAFWGPPWPDEGPWTEDMWKKTALHKLEPDLPSSIEYRYQLAASEAAAARGVWPEGVPDRPATAEAGGGTDRTWEGEWTEADAPDDGSGGEPSGWPKTAEPGGGEQS